jgi:hypothetical protein
MKKCLEETRVWQDVYANFLRVLFRIGGEMVGEIEEEKRSKFIKYKFIRVSRKKEINFHKFESQIKLREKKKHSRGRVLFETLYMPRYTAAPPVILWLLLLLFEVCVFSQKQNVKKFSAVEYEMEIKFPLGVLRFMDSLALKSNQRKFYENFIQHSAHL